MSFKIDPKKVATTMAVCAAFLFLASVTVDVFDQVLGHHRLFGLVHWLDLDTESNIPTWYQSSTLLACSALLLLIGRQRAGVKDGFAGHWTTLAAIFAFLSIDEATQIHENIGFLLSDLLREQNRSVFPWVFVGGLFFAVVAAVYARFVLKLPPRTRKGFIVSAALYVSGTLLLELCGAVFYTKKNGDMNIYYHLVADTEELFEMLGVLFFIRTLLAYLKDELKLNLIFGTGSEHER